MAYGYRKRFKKVFRKGRRRFVKYFRTQRKRMNATMAMRKRGWR